VIAQTSAKADADEFQNLITFLVQRYLW